MWIIKRSMKYDDTNHDESEGYLLSLITRVKCLLHSESISCAW